MQKINFEVLHKNFKEFLPGNLNRTLSFLDDIGRPQDSINNIIHVAGTNGKGSVISFIKSCLLRNRATVNAFISPHLFRLNERIFIKNEIIDDKTLADTIEFLLPLSKKESISFFEFISVCAIFLFNKNKGDWNLFEVGMGGKFDATNILPKKDLAIITPISYDHENFLGDNIFKIANEKIGITNNQIPTVVGPQPNILVDYLLKNFLNKPKKRFIYDIDWTVIKKKDNFYYEDNNETIKIDIPFMNGQHQIMNAATAIAAISVLKKQKKIKIKTDLIEDAIASTQWQGRLEKINYKNSSIELWIDSCHNPSGAKVISSEMIKMNSEEKKDMNLIFSLKRGKKIRNFLLPFEGVFKKIEYLQFTDDHYSYSEIIENIGEMNFNISYINKLTQSLILQKSHVSRVLICGSIPLVAEVMDTF